MPTAARLLPIALAAWLGVSGCYLHGAEHTRSSHLASADGESISTVAPGASVGYSESAVVTFSPRRDEAFVTLLSLEQRMQLLTTPTGNFTGMY